MSAAKRSVAFGCRHLYNAPVEKRYTRVLLTIAVFSAVGAIAIIAGRLAGLFEKHPSVLWVLLGMVGTAVLEGVIVLGFYMKDRFF